MSKTKKQIFIRGDLNSLDGGIIPLRNQVWIEILKREYGLINDKMRIWLYEKTQKNGSDDPTIFPGIIKDLGKDDEYDILVNEKEMKYLSESKEFNNYSIDDVINNDYFKKVTKELGLDSKS